MTGDDEFFTKRGVDPGIVAARPYGYWTPDDLGPIREAYAGLSGGQRGFIIRMAKQSPGWIIHRFPPPGLGLDPIFPEIRPLKAVETHRPTWHWHGEPGTEPPDLLEQLRELHNYQSPRSAAKHIHAAARMKTHIETGLKQLEKGDTPEPHLHCGVNTNEVHAHPNEAKYLFPPSGKCEATMTHSHSDYFKKLSHNNYFNKLSKWMKHVQRYHGGIEPLCDRHTHTLLDRDGKPIMVKDRDRSLARRLDMHPLAVDLFAERSVVFFVIEGCIKSDAVLSQREAVFSVPSVSLWQALPELEDFANLYLPGKTTIIVPDMDWAENDQVIRQARLCQTFLERRGFAAHVAAPPIAAGHKGIDDFLGVGRGCLDDLAVLDRVPGPDWDDWWADFRARNPKIRRDKLASMKDGQWLLAMHANPDTGGFEGSLTSLAKVWGVHTRQVSRMVEYLQDYGVAKVEGDLATAQKYIPTGGGNGFYGDWDWEDRPTITLIEPLRAQLHERRLGEMSHWKKTLQASEDFGPDCPWKDAGPTVFPRPVQETSDNYAS